MVVAIVVYTYIFSGVRGWGWGLFWLSFSCYLHYFACRVSWRELSLWKQVMPVRRLQAGSHSSASTNQNVTINIPREKAEQWPSYFLHKLKAVFFSLSTASPLSTKWNPGWFWAKPSQKVLAQIYRWCEITSATKWGKLHIHRHTDSHTQTRTQTQR